MNTIEILSEDTDLRIIPALKKIKMTPELYLDWLEGGTGYEKAESIIKGFLGEKVYNFLESTFDSAVCGILPAYFEYELKKATGIDFQEKVPYRAYTNSDIEEIVNREIKGV